MKELKNLEAIRETACFPPPFILMITQMVFSLTRKLPISTMISKNGNQTTGKQKSSNNLQYQNYLTN